MKASFIQGVLTLDGQHEIPSWPLATAIPTGSSQLKDRLYWALQNKHRAARQWRETFPVELMAVLQDMWRADPIQLMRLYAHDRMHFLRLTMSNPALLALCSFRAATWNNPHCKQTALLNLLGYQPNSSWVRILRKVKADTATHRSAHLILRLCEQGADKRLRHVRIINHPVITALEAWPQCPAQVLEVIADHLEAAQMPALIAQARRSRHLPVWPWKIHNIGQLHRVFEQTVFDKPYGGGQLSVPLDEIVGDIEALKTVNDVLREGISMRNGLGGWVPRLMQHTWAVYRVLKPERATLFLKASDKSTTWLLYDLRVIGNGQPSEATRQRVESWLAAENEKKGGER